MLKDLEPERDPGCKLEYFTGVLQQPTSSNGLLMGVPNEICGGSCEL